MAKRMDMNNIRHAVSLPLSHHQATTRAPFGHHGTPREAVRQGGRPGAPPRARTGQAPFGQLAPGDTGVA